MSFDCGRCRPEWWEWEALADGSREAEKWFRTPQVGDKEPSSSICACGRCGSLSANVHTLVTHADVSIRGRRQTDLASTVVTKGRVSGRVAVHAPCRRVPVGSKCMATTGRVSRGGWRGGGGGSEPPTSRGRHCSGKDVVSRCEPQTELRIRNRQPWSRPHHLSSPIS